MTDSKLTDEQIDELATPFLREIGGGMWHSGDEGIIEWQVKDFARAVERALAAQAAQPVEPVAVVMPRVQQTAEGKTVVCRIEPINGFLPERHPRALLYAAPVPQPVPQEVARDAERYRWLRQFNVDSYMAVGKLEALDAAIDAALSASTTDRT